MKIGCCVNMVAKDAAGIGIDRVETLARLGYDYVELPLAQMMALDDTAFETLAKRVEDSGIRCEACNNFFPASLRITGANPTPREKLADYIDRAIARMQRLGARTVIFGSSGAKNVPEGFDHAVAWTQIVDLLRLADERAAASGVIIAIEPLNRMESNIVLNAKEGLALAREVDRPSIRLLIDFYHLRLENEDLAIVLEAADYLQHMHIANPEGRVYPKTGDENDYKSFFTALKRAGYDERVSVEAFSDDFERDAPGALETMRRAAE